MAGGGGVAFSNFGPEFSLWREEEIKKWGDNLMLVQKTKKKWENVTNFCDKRHLARRPGYTKISRTRGGTCSNRKKSELDHVYPMPLLPRFLLINSHP